MATVLYSLSVPQLFDVVRKRQTNSYQPSVNYHVDCGQAFSALWPMRTSGLGAWVDSDYADRFFCPVCGHLIDTKADKTANVLGSGPVPLSADLSVVERPGELDLVLKYECVLYDRDFGDISKGRKSNRTDIIRFDFRKRKSFYIRKGLTRCNLSEEMGPFIPVNWANTPWAYLQFNETCYLEKHTAQLHTLVTTLKTAFAKALDKRIGYKSKPIRQKAVKAESSSGALGGLIDNLVWRMACPDGPGITAKLRTEGYSIYGSSMAQNMRTLSQLTVAGESFVNAFMDVFQIKPSKAARRLVTKAPFSAGLILGLAQQLTKDHNYELRLIDYFTELMAHGYSYHRLRHTGYGMPELIKFIKVLGKQYGEKAAIDFIVNGREFNHIIDTAVLYDKLNRASRKELWEGPRVQLRDLHDWCRAKEQLQQIQDVPVQGSKRYLELVDTVNGYEFRVPQSTLEIAQIGVDLHNCVRTYCGRVKDGKTAIVEVRSKGATVACLEVNHRTADSLRFSMLDQAKLKNNARVETNPEIKQAVLSWASKHKVSIALARRDIQIRV